jgi:hypothetical protein
MILSVGPFRPTTLAVTRPSPNSLWGPRLSAPSRARGRIGDTVSGERAQPRADHERKNGHGECPLR